MRKRAQTPIDVIMIVVFLALLAIGGVVAIYMYDQLYNTFTTDPALNSTEGVMAAYEGGRTVLNMWDFLTLAILLGSAISLMIIGYFIDVHSVFLPLFVIGLIVLVILSGVLSYVWEQVVSNSAIPQFDTIRTGRMPVTNHILQNLAIYSTIIGALAMIATYAKTRNE